MPGNTHSLEFVASSETGEESSQLCVRDHGGAWRPASGEEIISAARTALARRVRRGTALTSPHIVRDFLKLKLSALEHEVFSVIFLDNRHRLIAYGSSNLACARGN